MSPHHRVWGIPEGATYRILFESRGQFGCCSGATNRAPVKGRNCLKLGGPGGASPKSRPPGYRAGHAGYESFPLVLPGPYLWASMSSCR